MARIVSINISRQKGEKKSPVKTGMLRVNHGLEGDAHAGNWHRQVSLLARESIDKMRARGLELAPGDFAENFTTEGLDLPALPVGTRLRVGPALLEITQIGKKCHQGCAIYQQVGECVMPREGVFARVLVGGQVRAGDRVEIVEE